MKQQFGCCALTALWSLPAGLRAGAGMARARAEGHLRGTQGVEAAFGVRGHLGTAIMGP